MGKSLWRKSGFVFFTIHTLSDHDPGWTTGAVYDSLDLATSYESRALLLEPAVLFCLFFLHIYKRVT